jgi:hypothetical protein
MDKNESPPTEGGTQKQSTALERIFEKLLESSPKYQQLRKDVDTMFLTVTKLAQTTINLVQNANLQQQALSDLYIIQDQILKGIKSSSSSLDFLHQKIDKDKLN